MYEIALKITNTFLSSFIAENKRKLNEFYNGKRWMMGY